MADVSTIERRLRRDCDARDRGPQLRDALKKCITGVPSKPFENLEAAVRRLSQINDIVTDALKGLE